MRIIFLLFLGLVLTGQAYSQSANGKAWIPITPNIRDGAAPQMPTPPSIPPGYRNQWPIPFNGNTIPDFGQYQAPLGWFQPQPHPNASTASPPAQDDPRAKFLTGGSYWRGANGYPRNIGVAIEFLRQSAQSDFPPALYQLGRFYQTGRGVDQNQKMGDELIKKAWRLGLSNYDASLIDNNQVY